MRALHYSRFLMSVGLPLALFPTIFYLQLISGYEMTLFPLYLLPIAAFSWSHGLPGVILSVFAATSLWYWGSVWTGFTYTYEWTRYYNAGARGAVFLMAGLFILMFKRVVEQHRRRMEAMRALLNVCHGCGSVQGSDGRWIPIDELTVPASRPLCECPRCTRILTESSRGEGL